MLVGEHDVRFGDKTLRIIVHCHHIYYIERLFEPRQHKRTVYAGVFAVVDYNRIGKVAAEIGDISAIAVPHHARGEGPCVRVGDIDFRLRGHALGERNFHRVRPTYVATYEIAVYRLSIESNLADFRPGARDGDIEYRIAIAQTTYALRSRQAGRHIGVKFYTIGLKLDARNGSKHHSHIGASIEQLVGFGKTVGCKAVESRIANLSAQAGSQCRLVAVASGS